MEVACKYLPMFVCVDGAFSHFDVQAVLWFLLGAFIAALVLRTIFETWQNPEKDWMDHVGEALIGSIWGMVYWIVFLGLLWFAFVAWKAVLGFLAVVALFIILGLISKVVKYVRTR